LSRKRNWSVLSGAGSAEKAKKGPCNAGPESDGGFRVLPGIYVYDFSLNLRCMVGYLMFIIYVFIAPGSWRLKRLLLVSMAPAVDQRAEAGQIII
jgi:hypothetical protein